MAHATGSTTASSQKRGVPPGPGALKGIDDTASTTQPEPQYLSGLKFVCAFTCICIILFLVVLDGSIVSTAAPTITDEFRSLNDLGWYSSVYYMTFCIAQLQFGKLNVRYPIRIVYSCCMFLFLVGSAICGAAPNSPALIIGRAIAGIGSAGLLVGSFALIPVLTPPLRRPLVTGIIGGVLGFGMSVGPMIGGAFTENITWRWAFYMNLPIGGFCYFGFFFLVYPPKIAPAKPLTLGRFFHTLDLYGLLTVTPCVACLLIALQWGGTTYAWSNGRVIALLTLFGILVLAFIGVELWVGDDAMVPKRVVKQRSVIASVLFAFTNGGSCYLFAYYIPIWFQACRDNDPIQAGVNMLPLVIAQTIASISCGLGVASTGYIWPFMTVASVFTAIGAGLLTTFQVDISDDKWIGYQIIYGIGMGLAAQTPLMVAQNVVALEDIAIASSLIMMMQAIGGSVFISLVQAVFTNSLTKNLVGTGLSEKQISDALAGGVTNISDGLTGTLRARVLDVVNDSLTHAWLVSVVLTSVSLLGALAVEHRKIRGKEAKLLKGNGAANEEAKEGRTEKAAF
ncbi:HC-toxin efflux carrier TOXA [Diaporthe amygdali]|uniref:HC-toxin efflux carrier TOXA n=1 Tax=Phomopsis amygdali TaxID=1214568 RepID=UPI0022FE8378|nr:HC-toxin efflux carrier TOXA [Diaporthe amygdali]KAJ0124042.1 HC-toxin efflux carrier TOXA [Diaporthe amygdali]